MAKTQKNTEKQKTSSVNTNRVIKRGPKDDEDLDGFPTCVPSRMIGYVSETYEEKISTNKEVGNRPITGRYAQVLKVCLPPKWLKRMGLPDGMTVGDLIAMQMAIRATGLWSLDEHAIAATKEIRESIEGKSMFRGEVSGPNGAPLPPSAPGVKVIFVDAPAQQGKSK